MKHLKYDIPAALSMIKANLEAPPDTEAYLIEREGRRMAQVIATCECPSEAVRKTFGHALLIGAAAIGSLANCPTSHGMVNVQAIAGYYLMTGLPKDKP